ncbi:glycosyltransferase family 2 protein [Aeromonas sp. QDB12]|uniref:glycosyltransferase family 2 protein n=1 Tax=Aeromonas sp. QDB12 TaxID=2990483 RepID=UPI0022DEC0FE|nr:glycosyltransferase [Aeromonas sp. QDB12]
MISIIILTYNSSWEKLLLTLKSVINQDISLIAEVIVSDDGSSNDNVDLIKSFFHENNFDRYIINENNTNVGTVKNLLLASRLAKGKYIKPIGAGDLLFCTNTIHKAVDFMEENNSKLMFGKMFSYQYKEELLELPKIYAPRDISPYVEFNNEQIKRNMFCVGDWISGATLFYERNYLVTQLSRIESFVIYCEDLIQCLAVLDGVKISIINDVVIWYEVGEGISTSKDNLMNERLKQDHINFFSFVYDSYANEKYLNINKILKSIDRKVSPTVLKKVILKIANVIFKNRYLTNYPYHAADANNGFLSHENIDVFLNDKMKQ